jgi:uncharacterized protein (TIGR02996 family)
MSDMRSAFLDALAQNEDDTTTRLVYADWLDENGEHEEADRQRKWPAAKEWLVDFWTAHNYAGGLDRADDDDGYYAFPTVKALIKKAGEALRDGSCSLDCGADEGICGALRQDDREFWENISIVVGLPAPGAEHRGSYSCGC